MLLVLLPRVLYNMAGLVNKFYFATMLFGQLIRTACPCRSFNSHWRDKFDATGRSKKGHDSMGAWMEALQTMTFSTLNHSAVKVKQ